RILANCVEDTVLDRATLTELTQIIDQKAYPFAESISLSLLKTAVPKLEIFKNGHAQGQPVHRLEYRTQRKTPAAAVIMHHLVSELFPEWKTRFDDVLKREVRP
ncbi:ParA family protein, partial [Morganella morganii]